MAENNPLANYPGWTPAKLPVWKRKSVQVAGASMLAFVFGVAAGGGSEEPAGNVISMSEARTLADKAADKAAEKAAEETRQEVASEADGSAADLEKARAEAQRAAQQYEARIAKLATQRDKAREAAATAKAAAADARAAAEEAKAAAASAPEPESSSSGGTDPRFRTCGEANDNGYGPYRRGVDPEYDWYQDRDGDGVVCES